MNDDNNTLRTRVAELEHRVTTLQRTRPCGIRKRSARCFWGLPLYDIACGADPEKGEVRGHARGIVAIGDIATGVVAFGGIARGGVAIGGVALGLVSLGGCSLGLLLAIGGLAVGALAFGGLAVGLVAIGGQAVGYYALGGSAAGKHTIAPMTQDPIAVEFFTRWFPWLPIGPQ
jgi:hypothetical protein